MDVEGGHGENLQSLTVSLVQSVAHEDDLVFGPRKSRKYSDGPAIGQCPIENPSGSMERHQSEPKEMGSIFLSNSSPPLLSRAASPPPRWCEDGPLVSRRGRGNMRWRKAPTMFAVPGNLAALDALSFPHSDFCGHCKTELGMHEARWGTGLCDGCYSRCAKDCTICHMRLPLKQLLFFSGLCKGCYKSCDKNCRMCNSSLRTDHTSKWATGLCDKCYDGCQKTCIKCAKDLDRTKEIKWGTGLCDTCYSTTSKECQVCDERIEHKALRYNSGLCDKCYDESDKECTKCKAHIGICSLHWRTGMCDTCFDKFDKNCKICVQGLDLKSPNFSSGLCEACFDKFNVPCRKCHGVMTTSLHWGTGLCDICYDGSQRECVSCKQSIPLGSLHWGSGLCDVCYEQCERKCKACGCEVSLGQLHWGSRLCDPCFDKCDKVCRGCSQHMSIGELHWGTGLCDLCWVPEPSKENLKPQLLAPGVKATIAAQFVFYMAPNVLQPSLYLEIQASRDPSNASRVFSLVLTAASVAAMIAPIPLGIWAHRRGEREVYWGTSLAAAIAAFLFMCEPNGPAFALAWAVLNSPPAIRGVRAAYFAKHVSPEDLSRCGMMATTAGLMGGLVGPLLSTACNWTFGKADLGMRLPGRWFDGFIAGAIIASVSCALCAVFLARYIPQDKRRRTSTGGGTDTDLDEPHFEMCDTCDKRLTDQEKKYATALCDSCWEDYGGQGHFQQFARTLLIRFCVIAGLLEVSMNAGVIASFQPIVVGQLGWGSDDVAMVTLAGAGLSVVISYSLQHFRVDERLQTGCAAALYFVGVVAFTVPPLCSWRLVLGFLLGIKAQILFMSPFTAIFSRLIGRWRVTNTLTTALCLAPAIGAAAGTMMAPWFVSVAGTPLFLLAALPALIAVVAIAWLWHGIDVPTRR